MMELPNAAGMPSPLAGHKGVGLLADIGWAVLLDVVGGYGCGCREDREARGR